MAEFNSRQAALIALGNKVKGGDAGRVRTVVVETPATFSAAAVNDTMAGGVYIPAGSRVVAARLSCAAGAASSTITVGLRRRKDNTVLSATAITAATSIASAITGTPTQVFTGAYSASGAAQQILTDDAEVYLTFLGATSSANQAIRVEVDYVST